MPSAVSMASPPPAIDLSESRAYAVIAGISVLLSVTVLVIGLRIYTRFFMIKTVGWDDWAAIAAGVRSHLADR